MWMELSEMIPKLLILPFYLKIIILSVFASFDRYASNPRDIWDLNFLFILV